MTGWSLPVHGEDDDRNKTSIADRTTPHHVDDKERRQLIPSDKKTHEDATQVQTQHSSGAAGLARYI